VREGYVVANEFVDHESGRKGRRERSGFNEMFEAAERGDFDLLVFWSLDRFSREGIRTTIHYLQLLETVGVHFRYYTEPYLNTENELVSHILLAVMSYFAEYEAKKISRRQERSWNGRGKRESRLGAPQSLASTRISSRRFRRREPRRPRWVRQTGLAYNTVKSYLHWLGKGT